MKQYLEWLEKQINFCLEDKTMQIEHWAFCKAYEKFKSLETTTESEELTPYIEYHNNGNVRAKGQENSKGQREGLWEWFRENGIIHFRIPYKEGKEDGIVEWFYENGKIHWRAPYKDGKIDGIEEWFDEQGNIIKTTLWKDGELIEETKPELIPYIEYYSNGNVAVKGQRNSKGHREGIWEWFYGNGNIRWRTSYKEDKKDGIEEGFYPNENIRIRTPYNGGKEDGIEEWFHENGNIECRIPYKGGERDGIEEWFHPNGNITKTYVWKDGELIEETEH
jgi:antitoxin component YwqK of YwqJK toxin-antitoxin module